MMKPLQQHELYEHLSGFLKSKGIELTQGSCSSAVQKSCSFLTDAINLGQRGFEKVASEVDAKLDQARQVIHEKTAPEPPVTTVNPAPAAPARKHTAPKTASKPARAPATKAVRVRKGKARKTGRK